MVVRTREVKLQVVSNEIQVAPPTIKLPCGTYAGYVETEDTTGESTMTIVMLFVDDKSADKLGLDNQVKPVKFEVLRHVISGSVKIIEV